MLKYRLVDETTPQALEQEVNRLLADGFALIGEAVVGFDETGWPTRWVRELIKVEPSYSMGGSFSDSNGE